MNTGIESFTPSNKEDWRQWLAANHAKEEKVWLIMHKKSSSSPNITWDEAVDEALCFGWIDSLRRPIDSDKFMQHFSKRKAQSTWSKINKDKVADLIAKGQMADAGYESIEVAKKNGSWSILDEVEALELPDDLHQAFTKRAGALAYYESLSKSVKKRLLHWVVMAKRAETREKRIVEIAEHASRKEKPKQFRV